MLKAKPLSIILLILAAFLIYSNILNAPFVLDDMGYIANNPWVASLSNLLDTRDARYVGFATFALNHYLGGGVFAFHITNVAIHAVNAVLLYLLLLALFRTLTARGFFHSKKSPTLKAEHLALGIALVFVAHPVELTSVTYTTQRFTSLATLFYLGALLFYLKSAAGAAERQGNKSQTTLYYVLSLVFTVLAMKTKEISFTLPVVILVIEFGLLRHERGRKGSLLRVLPFLFSMLIIPLATLGVNGDGSTENAIGEMMRRQKLEDLGAVSSYAYLLGQSAVVLTYMKMLLIPGIKVSPCDFAPASSFFDAAVLIPSIILLSIIAAAVWLFIRSAIRRDGFLLLIASGILWFFLTLSVESTVIPIKEIISEHRVYLPGIGFIASVVTAFFLLLAMLKRSLKINISPLLLTALVVLFLAVITHLNNRIWTNEKGLYTYLAKLEPCSSSHHISLAAVYARQGRWRTARAELRQAVAIEPDRALAWSNLAKISMRLGLFDEAIKQYKRVVEIRPDGFKARYSLGLLYMKKGEFDEAEAELREALRIRPADVRTLKLRTLLLRMRAGELDPSALKIRRSQ